jgi:hypothetical protein
VLLLVLAACASNKTGFVAAGEDASADAGVEEAAPDGPFIKLGDAYFFYRGSGSPAVVGTKPECGQNASFGGWRALLAPSTLDDKDTLPDDLYGYKVIVSLTGLDPAPRDRVTDWVRSGGTLLVMTDAGLGATNDALNALLQAIGASITIDDALATSGAYTLKLDPSQPLGAGVDGLSCGDGATLSITAPAVAVDTQKKTVLATQPIGAGRVVVLADQTCAADISYTTKDCALSPDAPTRLGAFLKNLAR